MNRPPKLAARILAIGLAAPAVMHSVMIAGCSHNEARDANGQGGAASAPIQYASRVALTFTRIGQGEGIRFEGQGHFARFAASEGDRVPALLGVRDLESIPLDTCKVVDSAQELDRALAVAHAPMDVKLLSAGRIFLRGRADAATLVPKHYPELTPYVAGVIYGNEDFLPLQLQAGAVYEVSAEGSEEIGPFTAQAQAPRAFPSLDVPAYRRGTDLELKWQEAGEVSEPAMLTVAWSARGLSREVRCRVRDDGSFTVARDLLASMPPFSQLASAEVSLVRARHAVLPIPGMPPGDLEVALREVVPLPVASGAALTPDPPVPLPEASRLDSHEAPR